MPGSRRHLVRLLLPDMLGAVRLLVVARPDLQVVLAQAETLNDDFLDEFFKDGPDGVRRITGRSHLIQNAADVAIVASGTSTVETALMRTPMVVLYRLKLLGAIMGFFLEKTRNISMVNLIAGYRLVTELLQYHVRPKRIGRGDPPALGGCRGTGTDADRPGCGSEKTRRAGRLSVARPGCCWK